MLTSKTLKEAGIRLGFDAVGVANIERFKDAPKEMHPSTIFPETRSVIVMVQRIPRGAFRGIEEGTHWPAYDLFGYGKLNGTVMVRTFQFARWIEQSGWEAVPLHLSCTAQEWEAPARRRPNPTRGWDNQIHVRLAGAAAGLGELGWSKVFPTPQFGPRQRPGVILTDAPLRPDPLMKDSLCTHCMRCVGDCPGKALGGKKVSVKIEDRDFSWGDVDLGKCKLCHFGVDRKTSPFLAKDIPGLRMDVTKQKMSWKQAHDFGFSLFPRVSYYKLINQYHNDYVPICGARGCMRSCVDEMEKRGVIRGYDTPFIKRSRWFLENPV